eukprot:scaffold116241_cov33-Tisochrysis_lutea.AAC.1
MITKQPISTSLTVNFGRRVLCAGQDKKRDAALFHTHPCDEPCDPASSLADEPVKYVVIEERNPRRLCFRAALRPVAAVLAPLLARCSMLAVGAGRRACISDA